MDEAYTAKTRQTRQLVSDLNKISGLGPRYDVSVAQKVVAADQQTVGSNRTGYSLQRENFTELLQEQGSDSTFSDSHDYDDLSMGKTYKCPEGIECLLAVDSLYIVQELDPLELANGLETDIRYVVQNSDGDRLMFAVEQSTILARLCLCSRRSFKVLIFNNSNKHIMKIHRLYSVGRYKANVYVPPNNIIGTIEQRFTCIGTLLIIKNEKGHVLQKLRGSACSFIRCKHSYDILSNDGKTKLGSISDEYTSIRGGLFVDSRYLGVGFPADIEPQTKALLLGATLLLNIILYEN
ncbi:Scramblase [Popillia japonica]|uniref:Phospholipid scramblase n=1 Tax=Popillia japonica TaxID=7064 RepID=A0AAW1M1Y9_POPJA